MFHQQKLLLIIYESQGWKQTFLPRAVKEVQADEQGWFSI